MGAAASDVQMVRMAGQYQLMLQVQEMNRQVAVETMRGQEQYNLQQRLQYLADMQRQAAWRAELYAARKTRTADRRQTASIAANGESPLVVRESSRESRMQVEPDNVKRRRERAVWRRWADE